MAGEMSFFEIAVVTLKFYIPSLFVVCFRIFALGYINKRRACIGVIAHGLYMLLVPAFLIHLMGYGQYINIAFYIIILGSFSVLIFTTDTFVKTMFFQFVGGIVSAALSTVLNMIRHLTGASHQMLLLATFVCSALLFLLAIRFFIKPMRFIQENLHSRSPLLLLMPFLIMLISVLIPTIPSHSFEYNPVSCTVIILLVQSTFFFYLHTLADSLHVTKALSQKEIQHEILQFSLQSTRQRLDLMNEAMGQMHVAHHDQRHVNAILLELMNKGDMERVVAILSESASSLPPRLVHYCDNTTVNAAVSYYVAIAQQKNIRCEIRMDIPEELHYSELALSMVLSNLIENAIHACDALEVGQETYIAVRAIYTGQLVLEVQNPYVDKVFFGENGYPLAQKSGHGRGSESVRAFVEEVGGDIVYQGENGIFKVRLLL